MYSKIYISISILSLMLLSSCSKDSSTSPNEDEIIINDNVVTLEDAADIQIDTIEENQITLTFAGDAPAIQEDDILVGTEDGGYLRKVTATMVEGNIMEIETIQAVLTDAIENGSIDTTLSLTYDHPGRSPLGLSLVQKLPGVSVREGGIDISGTTLYSGTVQGVDVVISIPIGTIDFTPDLSIGFDISWGELESFHAIASGDLDFTFDLRGEFSGSLLDLNNDDNPIELATFSNTFIQTVGFVPVVEVVTLKFEAGYSFEIGYSGAIQSGFDSSISIECGAEWEHGDWSGVWDPSYEFDWHSPEWNAEAHVNIRGYVRPVISVEFYSVAGPYLDVEPYLRFEAGIEANPPEWYWGLHAGMKSTLGFTISVLDYELADFNTELLDPPYEFEIIADSGSLIPNTPPYISSLVADPDILLINETSMVTCSAEDEDGHDLEYSWATSCGTINGEGETVSYTAPPNANECTVACNVDDGYGGTDNQVVTIIVNGPPNSIRMMSPEDGQENLPLEISFQWIPFGSGATGYDIQLDTDAEFTVPLEILDIEGVSQDIDQLQPSTQYFWRVRGVNEFGDGPWPEQPFAFTTGNPPDIPELLVPEDGAAIHTTSVDLVWQPVDDALGYMYEISENVQFDPIHSAGSINEPSIGITDLLMDRMYYWHVSAYDEIGVSGFSSTWSFTVESDIEPGECSDIDGNIYQTIFIGDQEWMAENLKVTHFRNGDPIPSGFSNYDWAELTSPAFATYGDNPDTGEVYGNMYNWFAVQDERGVCPENWHVPTDEEFITLELYLGMSVDVVYEWGNRGSDEGSKLKEAGTDHWQAPNDGATNESGYTAYPGGNRTQWDGTYEGLTTEGFFWSSSEHDMYGAWNRYLFDDSQQIWRSPGDKRQGCSVRCIRDD